MLVTKNEVETASFRLEIELSYYAQKTIMIRRIWPFGIVGIGQKN